MYVVFNILDVSLILYCYFCYKVVGIPVTMVSAIFFLILINFQEINSLFFNFLFLKFA